MNKGIECVAVHTVLADRRYKPGETLHLSETDADALEAAGAVERAFGEVQIGETLRPVTLVGGIGPRRAERLAERDIETLEDLSKVPSPEGAIAIGEALDVKPDVVTGWIDQARVLIEAEKSGE